MNDEPPHPSPLPLRRRGRGRVLGGGGREGRFLVRWGDERPVGCGSGPVEGFGVWEGGGAAQAGGGFQRAGGGGEAASGLWAIEEGVSVGVRAAVALAGGYRRIWVEGAGVCEGGDRKSTRLNSSHIPF